MKPSNRIRMRVNKIFLLEPARALRILDIMSMLSDMGLMQFRHAAMHGITSDEWIKSQHFFLSASAGYREQLIEELKSI